MAVARVVPEEEGDGSENGDDAENGDDGDDGAEESEE
jgi:hypothetical protein